MKIANHRLLNSDGTEVRFAHSPNMGGPVQHDVLIMHFTAGRNFENAVTWLTNPAAQASAHVVIGRDGSIAQLVPFDRIAWHAGRSAWDGKRGLNRYGLGIELDNAGKLEKQGCQWRSWFGHAYPESEVYEAVHPHETEKAGWHLYTEVQLDAAMTVASALVRHYGIREILGHEDIAPRRKNDPGPAFPMDSFRAHVLGRDDDGDERHETTAHLHIRGGPGTQHETLPGSPLPPGTCVEVLGERGSWRRVDVLDAVQGAMDLQGWVHGRYLRRAG